jgi:hypothetical protein
MDEYAVLSNAKFEVLTFVVHVLITRINTTLVARAFKRLLKLSIERCEVLTAVVRKSCLDVMPCRLIVMEVSDERAASKFGVFQCKAMNMGQHTVLIRQ